MNTTNTIMRDLAVLLQMHSYSAIVRGLDLLNDEFEAQAEYDSDEIRSFDEVAESLAQSEAAAGDRGLLDPDDAADAFVLMLLGLSEPQYEPTRESLTVAIAEACEEAWSRGDNRAMARLWGMKAQIKGAR